MTGKSEAKVSTHEAQAHREKIKGSSDRGFGIVFVVVFALIGVWPFLFDWGAFDRVRWWSLGVAGVLLVISIFMPSILAPANKLWLKFGLLLHKIVSPIIMGLMFFVALTPVALIMRWRGKDLLNLQRQPEAETYWIERSDEVPGSMSNQF